MRKIAIILNASVAAISVVLLIATFALRSHLVTLAEDFVYTKTLEHTERHISLAEKASESKLIGKFLKTDQIEDLRSELKQYRKNPEAYLSSLVKGEGELDSNEGVKPAVLKFRSNVRGYFDSTLNSLIVDLRIFNFSNLLFSIFAIVLVVRNWIRNERLLLVISFIVMGVTLFGASMYWDGMSFFQILFKSYLGWSYPITILVIIGYILVKFRGVLPKQPSGSPG